ncbi:MAG: phospholipase D family protein [Actinomycetota bacterium]|nr:phospholipase D family protein [Actinomycetota bacterium]
MLSPETRALLTDGLRPPDGFRVDATVATTYSLDLTALLLAPLSFALHDRAVGDPERVDPIALLDAVRRHAARTTVFCQAGAIHQMRTWRSVLTFAEDSVVQVRAPTTNRVFHPKIWLTRFADVQGRTLHRFLCLSRNLTFDRSWDTVLRLDETHDGESGADPGPLADFVRRLPELVTSALPSDRRSVVDGLAESVAGVRFAVPDPFDELQFLPLGLGDDESWPFPDVAERILAISAFLDSTTSRTLAGIAPDAVVLSRPESFDRVGRGPFVRGAGTFVLQRPAEVGVGDDQEPAVRPLTETSTVPDGLHAKTFVVEHGTRATVVTGSANATGAGFGGNVEFDVMLRGPQNRCGVSALWEGTKETPGFSRLVEPYTIATEGGVIEADAEVAWQIELFHAQLAGVPPRLDLTLDEDEKAILRLTVEIPDDPGSTEIWPISLRQELHGQPLGAADVRWGPLALTNVTPFLAVRTTVGRCERTAVVKATLFGDVAGRRHDALRDVLTNRTDVLRYLIFLLGDPAYSALGQGTGENGGFQPDPAYAIDLALFEPLVRAVARNDDSLERIASVIRDLRAMKNGDELVPGGFQNIWDAVWECYRERAR